jgi:hypothetical protein
VTRYYKATRPDGTDFHTGTVDYGAALASSEPITHPAPHDRDASGYLSVATVPTDCTGMSWPCRLFAVEADDVREVDDLPNKRAVSSLRVVEELPAWQVFGPNGEAVVAVIDRARTLTADELTRLDAAGAAAWDAARAAARAAAWDEAWDAAGAAAWDAARDEAWDEAWDAAWAAARDAARAELVRDLITPEQYDNLTAPWRSVVGGAA